MDIKELCKMHIDIMDDFLGNLENIEEAFSVVDAINDFIHRTKELTPHYSKEDSGMRENVGECIDNKLAAVEKVTDQLRTEMMNAGYIMIPDIRRAWDNFAWVVSELRGMKTV